MFRKIVIVVSLFVATQIFADTAPSTPGGCGATYNDLGNFEKVFNNSKKDSSAKSARQAFSGFNCSGASQDMEGDFVITDIDFYTGTYGCAKVTNLSGESISEDSGNFPKSVFRKNLQCEQDFKFSGVKKIEVKPAKAELDTGHFYNHTEVEHIGFLPVGETVVNFGVWDIDVSSKFRMNYTDFLNKLEKASELNKDRTFADVPKIDTQKNTTNPTLSEVLTGVLTLNSDYFNNGNVIDKDTGKLNFAGDKAIFQAEEQTVLGSVFLDADMHRMYKTISSILDPTTWGFYVAFVENMRLAETSVVLFFFAIGFFGLIGQKMIQFGYSSFWKEDSREDLQLKKMVTGPLIMLATFTAPIVPSQLEIPSNYLNETTDVSAGIVLSGGSSSPATNITPNTSQENIQNSTIIQSAIRYFAHFGVISANKFADYALYPYLNYLQFKYGKGIDKIIENHEIFIADSQKQLLILQKEFEFYQYFCKPIYGNGSNDKKNIKASSLSLRGITKESENWKRTMLSNSKGKEIIDNSLGATTISMGMCANLSSKIEQRSNIVKDFAEHFIELEGLVKTLDDDGPIDTLTGKNMSKNLNSVSNFVQKSKNQQEQIGWIYSAIAPASYTMLLSSQVADSAKKKQEAISAISNVPKEGGISNDVAGSDVEEDWTIINKVTSWLSEYASFALFPGFTSLVKIIFDFGEYVIDGLINIAITASVFVFQWAALPIVAKLLTVKGLLAIGVGSTIKNIVLGIGAWFIAIFLYTLFIQIISTTFILMMIIYRIAFYFIELMIFFVASPVVVIWSVIQNKAEVIWNYVGRGLVLTITPVLIVLSCYIFIFCQELFITIQSIIIGLFNGTFDNSNASMSQTLVTTSIVMISTVLVQLALIIAGYVTIINFPKWFLTTVGAKSSDLMEESVSHFQQTTLKHMKTPV
ncbi:hypothetical protein [Campylobacter sp. JMF_03 NE3]|uniref:hypothetical protein n=1 Tax=Campylobacter sp. JMF_03 NE3 TaxID=2983831 RepID=UPI0022E99B8A|nr:hypothetical protein [Campylobacter sp. JMF_03 NE3]MDA3053527.1 hypothetical protein [Campylobacter sp. JMF_03 NE3]